MKGSSIERMLAVRQWAQTLKVGDRVRPLPLWNRTERHRKIAPAVVIEAIDREPYCQTGVMLTVSTTAGGSAKLDAGWFEPVLEQPAPGDELPAFDDRDA